MANGIFGWDLPPGCSPSDISGNRPEDAMWEAMLDEFYGTLSDELYDKFWKANLGSDLDDITLRSIEYGIKLGKKEQQYIDAENKFLEEREKEE